MAGFGEIPAFLNQILRVWRFVWRGRQQRQIIRIKAQRFLDDFGQFLDQQLPQHREKMEAITIEISSHFPATVGPQGAEIKAQLKAASERQRDILNHWQATQRHIEDLAIDAGLLRVTDSVVVKQLDDMRNRVEHVMEAVREMVRDSYFKTGSIGQFDEAWASVCS